MKSILEINLQAGSQELTPNHLIINLHSQTNQQQFCILTEPHQTRFVTTKTLLYTVFIRKRRLGNLLVAFSFIYCHRLFKAHCRTAIIPLTPNSAASFMGAKYPKTHNTEDIWLP